MKKKKDKSDREKIKTGISEFLLSYNCPSEYIGYAILCDLLKTALENYDDFTLNLKSIYYLVARQRKITRLCIERNLHTLIEHWQEQPKFEELFDEVPTNAKALHILARKIRYLNCSVYDTLLMP